MCGRGFASLALFPLRFNHALSTDSPREVGATQAAKPPKTERGVFRSSELGERTAALGLPPCGGRRPLSIGLPRVAVRGGRLPALAEDRFKLWLGQPRAQPTACPAWSAPRAACAFRLRLFSPDGENRSPRWGRLRDTTTDDNGTRGGAVGCCSAWRFAKAGSAAKPQTQRPRQNGVRGLWGIGASLQAKRG